MNIFHGLHLGDNHYYGSFQRNVLGDSLITSDSIYTINTRPKSIIHNISCSSTARTGMTAGSGINGPIESLCDFFDPILEQRFLYAGGNFDRSGMNSVYNVAKFDGHEWTDVHKESSPSGLVKQLIVYDNELYAVGSFTRLYNNIECSGLAKFNGNNWAKLNNNFFPENAIVYGSDLILSKTSSSSPNLSIYNGSSFFNFDNYPSGVIASVNLDIYNGNLIVAGFFGPSVSGIEQTAPHSGIMYYNSGNWHDLGLNYNNSINSMRVYNNEIYLTHAIHGEEIGGIIGSGLIKYNGTNWENFAYFAYGPSGTDSKSHTTYLFKTNDNLVISGGFKFINDIDCYGAVIWDGEKFSPKQFKRSDQFPHVPTTSFVNINRAPSPLSDVLYIEL
jgi:hypothetical protein